MNLTLRIFSVTPGAYVSTTSEDLTLPGSWEEANVYHVGDVLDDVPACPGRVLTITGRRWKGRDLVLVCHERKGAV